MTRSLLKTTAYAAFVAASAIAVTTTAEAGHGKEVFTQEYLFPHAMNGKQGFEGAYYCSYIKQPVEVALPNGQKKKVWKLTQMCY
jgi:hypothetical protein